MKRLHQRSLALCALVAFGCIFIYGNMVTMQFAARRLDEISAICHQLSNTAKNRTIHSDNVERTSTNQKQDWNERSERQGEKKRMIENDNTETTSVNSNQDWNAWLERQKERKRVIEKVCNHTSYGQQPRTEKLQQLLKQKSKLRNLLVDDKHKVIYCYIPKAGCSNWKRMFMILTGWSNVTNIYDITHEKSHSTGERMKLVQRKTTDQQLLQKLQEYKKVIVVRHPVERLISAYYDKIHHRKGTPPFQKQVIGFVRKIRSSATLNTIKWPEFISFVVSPSGRFNEHWQSFNSLCLPCEIEYDVIVKFESIEEDSERFLRSIHAPEHLHFPRQTRKVQPSLVGSYIQNLTQDQINGIYQHFGEDSDLFNYKLLV